MRVFAAVESLSCTYIYQYLYGIVFIWASRRGYYKLNIVCCGRGGDFYGKYKSGGKKLVRKYKGEGEWQRSGAINPRFNMLALSSYPAAPTENNQKKMWEASINHFGFKKKCHVLWNTETTSAGQLIIIMEI